MCTLPAHLDDGERGAAGGVVDGGVQARAEEVLVVLRVEAGREQRAVLRRRALALAQDVGAQAASQLGLVLDGAVLRRSSSYSVALSWCCGSLMASTRACRPSTFCAGLMLYIP